MIDIQYLMGYHITKLSPLKNKMKINQKLKAPDEVVNILSHFGASLRGHRLVKRLTHEEVALACNFSRQTLSRIERGDPSVAIGQVSRYASFLGVSKAFDLKMPKKVDETKRRVRHTHTELSTKSTVAVAPDVRRDQADTVIREHMV